MLTIKVGPQKVMFEVHEQQAFQASPYLHACLGLRFQGGSDRCGRGSEEDPEIFGSVVNYTYKGSFGPAQKCLSLLELREYRAESDPVRKTLFNKHNAAYAAYDAATQETSYFSVFTPGFKAMDFQMFCMLWDRFEKYPKIWKIADSLQMPALKNLAITRLYEDFEWKENDWRMTFVLACYDKPSGSAPPMFLSDIYGLGFRHIRKL